MACARPATAQTVFFLDGSSNLGYTQTSGSGERVFLDVRPAVTLQTGSPGLVWRFGYLFDGSLTLAGNLPSAYSNQASLSLAAQLSNRSTLLFSVNFIQGGNWFQLSQQAPGTGQPGFLAPGNPDLLTGTLGQSYSLELAPNLRLGQTFTATLNTPQYQLSQFNAQMAASVGVFRLLQRDAIGVQFLPTASLLRPLVAQPVAFWNITNALVGNWNHDFDPRWNGQVTAGFEQVLTFAGSYPLALVPTASATVRYLGTVVAGSLAYAHGVTTDVQTGTVTMSDSVVGHALASFDPVRPRVLGVSAGFVRSLPLGQASALVAAGTGNALQGDVSFVWGFADQLLGTIRYSVAYQYDQPTGIPPALTQVLLVGVTLRLGNSRYQSPVPTLGQRVDGTDAVFFPGSEGSPP